MCKCCCCCCRFCCCLPASHRVRNRKRRHVWSREQFGSPDRVDPCFGTIFASFCSVVRPHYPALQNRTLRERLCCGPRARFCLVIAVNPISQSASLCFPVLPIISTVRFLYGLITKLQCCCCCCALVRWRASTTTGRNRICNVSFFSGVSCFVAFGTRLTSATCCSKAAVRFVFLFFGFWPWGLS